MPEELYPRDWQPKSAFWKSILEKAEFQAHHKKWHLQCPDCGHHIDLDVAIPQPLRRSG